MIRRSLALALTLSVPAAAYAYPNGTPQYVTDMAPFCASCHSSVKAEYMPELGDAANKETPEGKHYFLVRMPVLPSPYVELSPEQKEALINGAKHIDENSTVTVSAPVKARPNEVIMVTVQARGGNGPVICVMLVDRAIRYQSRPVSSDGWIIAGEPEVKGQNGKAQKAWFDKRISGLPRNINYVNIDGQVFDPAKKIFPEGTVTYKLKAPVRPGQYTIAAAFLYGTENANTAGFFQRPSGRILFSDEVKITVE